MNHGTTASLICPACGQAFLSMQQSMEGMVQCPHCAHNSLRGAFDTQAQVAGVVPLRRRVFQAQQPQSLPAPPSQTLPSVSQPVARPGGQPPPLHTPAVSVVRQTLQPSQALLPTGEPPPPEELKTSPLMRPWGAAAAVLAFAVVGGGAFWLWWDNVQASAAKPGETEVPQPASKVVASEPPTPQTQVARAVIPAPDTGAVTADTKTLVTELFAADSAERRAACIHDGAKYSAEIEALFGATGDKKNELRLLSRIPGMPQTLPGGEPVLLFKLVTSACANGALVRLEKGADGKRRISWPLLKETHEEALAGFLKEPAGAAGWFYVGLRPNHGLDIPAELRPRYMTFDVQASAGMEPHFVACVERDTPFGRFMDRETEWGKSYLARLLVRRLEIKSDALCLLVIDCEGAPER